MVMDLVASSSILNILIPFIRHLFFSSLICMFLLSSPGCAASITPPNCIIVLIKCCHTLVHGIVIFLNSTRSILRSLGLGDPKLSPDTNVRCFPMKRSSKMVGSGSLHPLAPVAAALLVTGCSLLCLSDKGVLALSKPAGLKFGGWQPIKDLNDPHVREVGEFAVSEHNKEVEHDQQLSLRRVVRGETQVVAGINYRLLLEVDHDHQPEPAASTNSGKSTDGDSSSSSSKGGVNSGPSLSSYEAVVWEKAWEGFRHLSSFRPVDLG